MSPITSSFDTTTMNDDILSSDPKPKKKRRIQRSDQDRLLRWRSVAEQNTYSKKLFESLQHQTLKNGHVTVQSVRQMADRVLATVAKGRTRWSRAILSKVTTKYHKKARSSMKRKMATTKGRVRVPVMMERKVRELGRLVPGCRKFGLEGLVEETADYVAALEMQVKAMAVVVEMFVGDGGGGSGGGLNKMS
ncbi:hypothetical protein Droror1_Dr00023148 [Drosera rotundifolia]